MAKRIIMYMFGALSILNCGNYCKSQTFTRNPTWKQNFSSSKKESLKDWSILIRNYETGNAFFTDSIGNVFIKNGCLYLKATADRRDNKECSSGYVSTRGFKSFLYGKLEIRAKVPFGEGIFPAIWMLRADHRKSWPIAGEIDIMEYIECFKKEKYATTIHILNRDNGNKNGIPTEYKHWTRKETDITKFHVYGLEWTPHKLTFSLDYEPYYTFTKSEAEFWPFDSPYVLILDVGFGGWGAKCGIDYSILPLEMLIDWIRYYPLIEE